MISPNWVRSMFAKSKGKTFSLTLWDNKTTKFGKGRSEFDLVFKTKNAIVDVVKNPTLGFGENYMAGKIDVNGSLNALLAWAIQNEHRYKELLKQNRAAKLLGNLISRGTSITKQKRDISHHYDLGNDFYKLWLDKQMVYSCAYFKSLKDSIDLAQKQKINHTLAKLRLKSGEQLLDVGSGWGAIVIEAAKKYKVKAVGITLSRQQLKFARERAKREGASKLARFEYMDFREIPKSWHAKFDKWVSVGMYEHVGKANWPIFVRQIKNVLKPKGMGLLHSIAHEAEYPGDPFVSKYIFPGGFVPSIAGIVQDLQDAEFFVIDLENLRPHYALTLDRWLERFEDNAKVVEKMFDEKFVRMWRLYLVGSAESFRCGKSQIVQILFSNGLNTNWPLERVK